MTKLCPITEPINTHISPLLERRDARASEEGGGGGGQNNSGVPEARSGPLRAFLEEDLRKYDSRQMSTLLPALAINRPQRPWSTFLLEFVDIDNRYYSSSSSSSSSRPTHVPTCFWDSQLSRSYTIFFLYSFSGGKGENFTFRKREREGGGRKEISRNTYKTNNNNFRADAWVFFAVRDEWRHEEKGKSGVLFLFLCEFRRRQIISYRILLGNVRMFLEIIYCSWHVECEINDNWTCDFSRNFIS